MMGILGFAVVGGVLVAFVWGALNELLSGHVQPLRLGISAVLLMVFVVVLRMLGRSVARWTGAGTERREP